MIDDLSAVQIEDLAGMAKAKQISLDEAIERYGYQRLGDQVADRLKATFADQLAGFAYVTDSGSSVWIGFRSAIPPQAVELAKTLPVPVELKGNLGYTESELPQAQGRVHQALQKNADISNVATWYSTRNGTVEALVVPAKRAKNTLATSALQAIATAATANSSIKVNVSVGDGPLDTNFDKYIRGGGNLSGCTSNFNLISASGSTKRLGTAGHCSTQGQRTYCNQSGDGDCTTVNSKWSYEGPGGDVGMYDHGTMTATRTFYWDWGQKRYADSRSGGPVDGHFVCKFGFATGRSCGDIVALNYTIGNVGGQVVTNINATSTTCWFGDSGGPFYRDAQAYGVLKGAAQLPNGGFYCAFTPVNRFYNGASYYVWTR
ncbi:S1 family peptidase [Nonomuraea sp. NPDC059023]|uniref:S1 family peptidase n=1 Tax=unclassified Nonomuraea TaxID=2593643 RepID=UPI0036C4EBD9